MGSTNAVLVSCFDWYETRLRFVAEYLRKKGYEVSVLISDFEHGKKRFVSRRHEGCTYIHVPAYRKNISVGRIISHYAFGRSIYKLLNEIKPSLVYALLPPNAVIAQCRRYKLCNPGTKLIADVIDLWPESLGDGMLPFSAEVMWARMRSDGLAACDYVFTECDMYRERIRSELPVCRTSTLHLCRIVGEEERAMAQAAGIRRVSTRPANGTLRLGYVGSMNHVVDIEGVSSLIAKLVSQGIPIDAHMIGDGESRDKLLCAMENAGAEVTYYGQVYDQLSKIAVLGTCDYGINMMRDDVAVGLSIKSVDYLSMGLPLLNNIKGDTWTLVEEECVGVNVCKFGPDALLCNLLREEKPPAYDKVIDCFERNFSKDAFEGQLERGFKKALYM